MTKDKLCTSLPHQELFVCVSLYKLLCPHLKWNKKHIYKNIMGKDHKSAFFYSYLFIYLTVGSVFHRINKLTIWFMFYRLSWDVTPSYWSTSEMLKDQSSRLIFSTVKKFWFHSHSHYPQEHYSNSIEVHAVLCTQRPPPHPCPAFADFIISSASSVHKGRRPLDHKSPSRV